MWDDKQDILDVVVSVNRATIEKAVRVAVIPVCTCQLTKKLLFDFK